MPQKEPVIFSHASAAIKIKFVHALEVSTVVDRMSELAIRLMMTSQRDSDRVVVAIFVMRLTASRATGTKLLTLLFAAHGFHFHVINSHVSTSDSELNCFFISRNVFNDMLADGHALQYRHHSVSCIESFCLNEPYSG